MNLASRTLQRLVIILEIFACSCGLHAQQSTWALKPGDRVVFYGDSITEQRFYTWWTELYAVTRFPQQHVRFWNAGVGGDRVTGGGGGDIETRLSRDLFSHKPSVVTIMLGMNDGSYRPLTADIEHTYAAGYEHILQTLKSRVPEARVLCIGPSPYDEVTRPTPLFPGGYNSAMKRFGEIDSELARKYGTSFTDANAPFVAALEKADKKDRLAATLLVPDRVHPSLPAHLLIAMAVLRGWHAPANVSRTEIDGATTKVVASEGVAISGLSSKDGALSWTSLEEGLPLPLGYGDASFALMKEISPFAEEFNQEPLTVRGLGAGTYKLRIDDADIGSFTQQQLAEGVNLAEVDTPMRRQSQSVEWTVRDKGDLQFVRNRILIGGAAPESLAALDAAEDRMQESIWKGATPVPHQFRLTKQ